MPELATLLDQLIETTPPADDSTGRATFDALDTWRLIRNLADHQIVAHAAQLDQRGVAQKTGSTTKKLLIETGHAPAAAHRTMRSVDALPTLPALARHAADGRLSSELVDAIVRGMNEIEKRSGDALPEGERARYETELIAQALSGATPTQVRKHARAIGNTLCDASGAGVIPASDDAGLNAVNAHTTDDGRVEVHADLTQVVGEKFLAMIDQRSCPRPEPDGAEDRRTAEQRRADAFELILDQAAIGATLNTIGSPRTQLMLTIPATGDLATLPWTGSVSQASAKQASCDGSLTEIILNGEGVPLQMGRTHRLFPAHLRRAMVVRDACCIKCGAPPSHTQVHHVAHWADGGPTDLDNGCLLCQRCHTQVHHHGWDIVLGYDRHPWLVPPATIDPQRRPQPAYNRRTMRLDGAA